MDPGDVTLAIPCYNVAETLPRVLAAVDRLDPAPAALLCVDDGSSDGTARVLRSSNGVELVEHPSNRGVAAARNTALASTTTPWLAMVDADVLVEPDWLGRMIDIVTDRDVDAVQGRLVEQVTTTADRWRQRHPSPSFPDKTLYNQPINSSNVLCRAAALRDVGGWDERFVRAFDDIDLFERLIRAGHQVFYTPTVSATHVRTDSVRDALRLAWAYHHDLMSPDKGRHAPERYRDVLLRSPQMILRSMRGIRADVRHRDFSLLWISLLRPLFHLWWDVDSVRTGRTSDASTAVDDVPVEDCLELGRMEYGEVTIDVQDERITDWLHRMLCRGWYERQEAALIGRHLDVDADVVELGGGIGYVACLVDKRLSASSTHVVVEPNDDLVSLIEHHRELNDGAYEVLNAAYSTADAETLHVPAETWKGSLLDTRETTEDVVRSSTLDLRTLLDRFRMDDAVLIVDIEGSEIDLINDELDVLEDRCRLLIVEFHPQLVVNGQPFDIDEAKRRLERSSFERVEQQGSVAAYRSTG